MNLPQCFNCANEVKPGEDYCWSCLGELQEPEPIESFTAELKTYYSKKLLDRLVPALVHANHGI